MKTFTLILTGAVLLGCAAATQAAETYHQEITVNRAIPDGDGSGLASVLNVSLAESWIEAGSLTASLNISGTGNGDLYAYLTHGSSFAVLLNRTGVSASDRVGYGGSGLGVTFSDSAANGNIHFYQTVTVPPAGTLLSGAWMPDGRYVSPYAVIGTEPATATLSSFNNSDPNGEWVLYVADVNGGDLHQFNSWSLDFETLAVPEPGCLMLLAGLAACGWVIRGRKLGC
jgi:subtilisin-like proprotein convertase family protein